MIRCILALVFSLFNAFLFAQSVSGVVTNQNGLPLAFASIVVKGTDKGTSTNSIGKYTLDLAEGDYVLVAQHVGYKSEEKSLRLTGINAFLDFKLAEQQYDLGNVVVGNGEDPAYAIIRKAIEKRSFYEKEIKKFETEVYIKGQLKLRNYPKRLFGREVDFEDGDTSKRKTLFLSESVARYSVDGDKQKVEVLSTKVSGQSDAFGFSNPQVFSFYQNSVNLGPLNPRGFVSPIADKALSFYNYKFEGTFFDNGKMVNRIKVIPKRTYEPLFNGYINITEDDWRIYSTQLTLYKENQMQLADTLVIEQLYIPLGNVWVIKQQTLLPSVQALGFNAFGSFVQVYDKFNLNPTFAKNYFGNTVLKIYDSANKKTIEYWDSVRPVPLLSEEILDYKKKDSLELARKDPKYLDSLDKKRNKLNLTTLLLSGQTFGRQKSNSTLQVDALVKIVSYNTVEGWVVDFKPVYTKQFSLVKRSALTITPGIRYGFSNERLNPSLKVGYRYGKKYFNSITLSGGSDVFQYYNANPVRIFMNSRRTLYNEENFLKIYEAGYARLDATKGLGNGFALIGYFEFQDRRSLQNTTDYSWRDIKDRIFTPNITQPNHQAASVSLNLQWKPGNKYIELPDRIISAGSKYPTLNLSVTQGLQNVLGSDVDYTKWRFSVNDDINLKLAGNFGYRITAGGFLNNNASYLPDYTHYFGNLGNVASPYLNSFQLMPYYDYSNTSSFYTTAHVEHHFNGLLTNKIPVLKKLNWFLVTGSNFLYLKSGTVYGEVFAGLDNILKVGRFDFVQSFGNAGWKNSSIRYSVAGF